MLRGLRYFMPGLLLAGIACGGGANTSPGPAESPARVEVSNGFALPVDLYAVGSGITHRLGTVHPGMTGSFVVPPTMVGNGVVEFQARTTSQTYRSGPIMLAPGRVVDFNIAAQLFNSTVSLRP